MNLDEQFYSIINDAFDEYIGHVQYELQLNNLQYKNAMTSINDIIKKYPNIESVIEQQKEVALSIEESKALIEYLNLISTIKDIENREIFFKGGHSAYIYLNKIGIIKT